MIRLTHVINNLQVGGAETMLLRLAQHIDRAVCEMRVISLIGDGPIGEVTSGCLSPTLGQPIAMALVDSAFTGTEVEIDFGKKRIPATVAELPFYKR